MTGPESNTPPVNSDSQDKINELLVLKATMHQELLNNSMAREGGYVGPSPTRQQALSGIVSLEIPMHDK